MNLSMQDNYIPAAPREIHNCTCMIMGSEALIKLPKNATVPGLIVFGDSIADHGRFTNARTPSDMIELGIKELVPAYLDPSLQIKDLSTDASFDSGGTRYDPQTSKLVVRTILAIGCGCGNFEAHLFSKGLLTMCLLEFEEGSQVQPTPERGLPALLGSLTSMQFPYPSLSFDMINCAQCGVDWEKKGGFSDHWTTQLVMELPSVERASCPVWRPIPQSKKCLWLLG